MIGADAFMIVQGKPFASGMLGDYGVSDGALVHVSRRARGGCFMVSFSILLVMMAAMVGSVCTCGMSLVLIPVLLPFLFILPLFCL